MVSDWEKMVLITNFLIYYVTLKKLSSFSHGKEFTIYYCTSKNGNIFF